MAETHLIERHFRARFIQPLVGDPATATYAAAAEAIQLRTEAERCCWRMVVFAGQIIDTMLTSTHTFRQ